ncbi:MAG: tetratricopeptide repeat protein, partial [Gemmatimonadales bacterium]
MTPERWQQIQTLFARAAELPPVERSTFLAEACGSDTELREEVAQLLAAEAAGSDAGAISRAVGAAAAELAAASLPQRQGTRIGPWRIAGEIGQGGMGTVYLVERADDAYRARAALKLIRSGFAGGEALRRFWNERQILADLHHPNIAGLLDGGTAEDGTPYLVMEYVDGLPIDVWCDRHRLGVADRLRLFRQVCDAVSHAHRALVVHRDIKPSNILVSADGTPKLLDFGIAKLLAPEGSGVETATVHVMTPAYASPEQVRGERIGVGTDVYSLGVVLYQLLTGHLPLEVDGVSAATLAREICEREPPRPSARPDLPAGRAKALRGDLDTIILQSLRKEPERRYPAVAALSADLDRHLAGEPVTARPVTWSYRTGKFIRRHPLGVAAGAGFVVLVLGLSGFYFARVTAERDRARRAQARAEQVAGFLKELFTSADPSEAGGRQLTAREMLDRGVAQLATRLPEQPGVRAELMGAAADAYQGLGVFAPAESLATRVLEIQDSLHGPASVEYAGALLALGAVVFQTAGPDSQRVLAARAARILEAHPDADQALLANAYTDLGFLASQKGEYPLADSLTRRGLAIRRLLGPPDVYVSNQLNELATIRRELGDTAGSDTLLRASLDLRRRLFGDDHRLVAASLNNLAIAREAAGAFEEAERLYREAIAINHRLYGPGHPEEATQLVNLGRDLRKQGKLDQAREALQRAIEIDSTTHGAGHPWVAYDIRNLAAVLQDQGDLAGAEREYRRSLAIYLANSAEDRAGLGLPLEGLGEVLLLTGRPAAARPRLERALRIYRSSFGDAHPRTVHTRYLLGRTLTELGLLDPADS